MKDSFYSAFESEHRGPRELIKSRQKIYNDFIFALADIYPQSKACDLGCGRGEWLELLRDAGFDAIGVDLDEGMLSYCHDLGLNVIQQDVIQFLKNLDDDSVSLISSFHLIEHIGFENVKILVQEALRVLKPDGLLILETPNCENIIVGTHYFYLDPTHVTPIPNELLSFLTRYSGFKRNKIIRLQGEPSLTTNDSLQLIDVFERVSKDYGLIAQKDGPENISGKFDNIYNKEYGVSMNMAVAEFSSELNSAFNDMKNSIIKLENKTHDLESQLKILYSSFSWRVTAPFRFLKKVLRFTFNSYLMFLAHSKKKIKQGFFYSVNWVSQKPNLRRKLVYILKKLRVYATAKNMYGRINTSSGWRDIDSSSMETDTLSPHAKQIYWRLVNRKDKNIK